MLKQYFNSALKSIKTASHNVQRMNNDFKLYKKQNNLEENFNSKKSEIPNFIKMNPFFWGFKAKLGLKTWFNNSKTSNLLGSAEKFDLNTIAENQSNKLTNVFSKAKTGLARVIVSIKDLIINMKVKDIVKVTITNFPLIIRKISHTLVIITTEGKNYLVKIKDLGSRSMEKYKSPEVKDKYDKYMQNVNNSIIKYSGMIQPVSQRIRNSSIFGYFTSNKRIDANKLREFNNILKAKGFYKKFLIYKSNVKSYLKEKEVFKKAVLLFFSIIKKIFEKIGIASGFTKLKYLIIGLLMIYASGKIISVIFSGSKERKLEREYRNLLEITENLKKQNEEIIKKNDSLMYMINKKQEHSDKHFSEFNKKL